MSDSPPDGTADVTEWLWRKPNTGIHAGLGLAGMAAGLVGALAIILIATAVGLYIPPQIVRGWVGTFDFVNGLFIFMWSAVLISFGVNDGDRYHLRLRGRIRRTRASDAVVFSAFPVAGLLWGEFVLRPILAARAVDPWYIEQLAWAAQPDVLRSGVTAAMVTYYTTLTVVFVLALIGLRYNPVDLDAFQHARRRILQFGRS